MTVSDKQVSSMMANYSKHGCLKTAAATSGMDRKTARKYRDAGHMPSEFKKQRTWRTRTDPFEVHWAEVEVMLKDACELEARALFEYLLEKYPEDYIPGQLRTFQRKVKSWRAMSGPENEVFFAQVHRAGEALQLDFTWMNSLHITLEDTPFNHMLCHSILPFSKWQWATICHSESIASIRDGLQGALFQLGFVPQYIQTDNSTAATHSIPGKGRAFNEKYLEIVRHLGLKARTIAVGKKEQNGSVESLNGAMKRRIKQHLLLRGSSDFENLEAYEMWLQAIFHKVNKTCQAKVDEELKSMKPLIAKRLVSFDIIDIKVTTWSTIRIKDNAYSVPSRLIEEKVRVRLYESYLEVWYNQQHQFSTPRLLGRSGHAINYRHIIWSLVRKPGAFARYRYREDLFPTLVFRQTYDKLCDTRVPHRADIEYLRILLLAASTVEEEVELALEMLLEASTPITIDEVKTLVQTPEAISVPMIPEFQPDLAIYDTLLTGNKV